MLDSLFQSFQLSRNFCHHDNDRDPAGSFRRRRTCPIPIPLLSCRQANSDRGLLPTPCRAWRCRGVTQCDSVSLRRPRRVWPNLKQPKAIQTGRTVSSAILTVRATALSFPRCVSGHPWAVLLRVVRFRLTQIAANRLERAGWSTLRDKEGPILLEVRSPGPRTANLSTELL